MAAIRTALALTALAAAAVPTAHVGSAPHPTARVAAVSEARTFAPAEAAEHRVRAHAALRSFEAPVHHVAPVAPRRAVVPARRGTPYFSTPEAAMRYLSWAYSAHADKALAHITTPDARSNLLAMRDYAPALSLESCTRLPAGDYDCAFSHTLAKHAEHRHGHATFRVAPAVRHGWYMTMLLDCGDAEAAG
jgi:hypothetical protein